VTPAVKATPLANGLLPRVRCTLGLVPLLIALLVLAFFFLRSLRR
jgi:hypothetical protein